MESLTFAEPPAPRVSAQKASTTGARRQHRKPAHSSLFTRLFQLIHPLIPAHSPAYSSSINITYSNPLRRGARLRPLPPPPDEGATDGAGAVRVGMARMSAPTSDI